MIQKLNKEEFQKLGLVPIQNVSWVHAIAASLAPGEGAEIKKGIHWTSKRAPWYIVKAYEKKTGRKFERYRLADGSGWAIQRVK